MIPLRPTKILLRVVFLALLWFAPPAANAARGASQPAPNHNPSGNPMQQDPDLVTPYEYFSDGLGPGTFDSNPFVALTSSQNRAYTASDLQQTSGGRYFVIVNVTRTGLQTLGLLISSSSQQQLLDYLNSVQVFFVAVAIYSGQDLGFRCGGECYFPDDVGLPNSTTLTGDIDVEMVLQPGGDISSGQEYAVYFVIDPVIAQQGGSHLYHSPSWHSFYTWAVAEGGTLTYELWRNNPGAFEGSQRHSAGQQEPQPLLGDISPDTANFNALITAEASRTSYRLYGGFTGTPRTIDAPASGGSSAACPLPPRMQLGALGIVDATTPTPNRLRSQPSLNGSQIGLIPTNEIFTVIDGPVCANGIQWWQVDYNGRTGWTAEGQNGTYYIRPYS